MNQMKAAKWSRRAVWTTLAIVATIGCNPLSTISFLTQSDPVKPAEYPLAYEEGPKKGKEISVALFISSSPGIGQVFAGSESKLVSEIAKRLPEMAKENKLKLTVIEPSIVNKFKMKYPNWKVMHPTEWGKKLNVDFVLDIHLEKMSLYQDGSLNHLYQGKAEVSVDAYEMDLGAEPKWQYVLVFSYPHTGLMLDPENIPVNRFKQDYLEHLALEICRKHVKHKEGSGIADDR
jgi:hypothetical protein